MKREKTLGIFVSEISLRLKVKFIEIADNEDVNENLKSPTPSKKVQKAFSSKEAQVHN